MASYPFTAESAKRAEKDLLVSLWGLSVLCGEMWGITCWLGKMTFCDGASHVPQPKTVIRAKSKLFIP